EKLMKNKLGITFDHVKNAPYADFPNGYRPLTVEEAGKMQRSIDNIYNIFKGHVAAGRKLDINYVDSVAQGRVWSGSDAVANKLADGLGDLNRAIASAASMAKLKDYSIVTYPEVVDEFDMLLKRMGGDEGMSAAVKANIEKEMSEEYPF